MRQTDKFRSETYTSDSMSNKSSKIQSVTDIHGIQPWFVMTANDFLMHVAHENPMLSHFYSFKGGQANQVTFAIPDGCVDVIFDCDSLQPNALVIGTTLEASEADFLHHHRYFGIRFIPGVVPEFFGLTAAELIDKKYNLLDLLPHAKDTFEQVVSSNNFLQQIDLMNTFLKKFRVQKTSRLSMQVLAKIFQHNGNVRIKDLEAYTGYSIRTLQRQFRQDTGLTPKSFSRVVRCQSAVYEINHREELAFSGLAFELGFSDQPHFLREFKKLVSTTPLKYQQSLKQSNYANRIKYY